MTTKPIDTISTSTETVFSGPRDARKELSYFLRAIRLIASGALSMSKTDLHDICGGLGFLERNPIPGEKLKLDLLDGKRKPVCQECRGTGRFPPPPEPSAATADAQPAPVATAQFQTYGSVRPALSGRVSGSQNHD